LVSRNDFLQGKIIAEVTLKQQQTPDRRTDTRKSGELKAASVFAKNATIICILLLERSVVDSYPELPDNCLEFPEMRNEV